MVHLLEDVGAEVVSVPGGQEAIDALQTDGIPDVAFLDIRMPETDGPETLKQIRTQRNLDVMKVFAVSASVLDVERKQVLDAGFDAFIGKPFRFEQVYAVLGEQLGVEFVRQQSDVDEGPTDFGSVIIPGGLLERLREAANYRQVTQMENCFNEVEQLGPEGRQLAGRLRELRNQHRMDSIIALLEGIDHG